MLIRPVAPALSFRLHHVALTSAWAVAAGAAGAQAGGPPPAMLNEVRVKAEAERPDALPAATPGGKTARGARLGVLGNTDVADAPFSVTAITAEAIADQQAQTVGAVLRGDPSVRTSTNEGHVVENFVIRGFAVGSSSMSLNGMFGLAPEQSTPVELFERLEVLRGPSAMLTGLPPTGDVGGVVNLAFKRAGDTPTTRFTGSVFGDGNVTAHADIGRRLGEEQRLGVRVNAVMSDGETQLEHQTQARHVGHVAVDYRGRGWRGEVDFYAITRKVRKGSPMQPILTGWTTVPEAPAGDTNFFYGEDVFSTTRTQGVLGRATWDFTDRWSAYAAAGHAEHDYSGFIFGTRPVFPAANAASGAATGTAYNSWGEYRTDTFEVGLRGSAVTGPVTHKTAFAVSLLNYDGGSRANGTSPIASNLYQPTPITMPAGAAASTFRAVNDDTSRAISVADTIGFAEDRVLLTLGVRAQQIEQHISGYDEEALTPLVGLVVKPWGDGVSLYGNYVEGLSPGTRVPDTYANGGTVFEPYVTKSAEVGVKLESGAMQHTVSLFQITKPALVTVGGPSGTQSPDGEQRNRGAEYLVSGRVLPTLTVLGGVAYTKAEQTKAATPANNGKAAFGVPEFTANLAADWSVPWVAGLTATGQLNHTGAQWLSGDNSVELPAWTTVDAGLRYTTRVGDQTLTLRGAVTNVTDKHYFASVWGEGRVNVGAPRALRLSVSLDI